MLVTYIGMFMMACGCTLAGYVIGRGFKRNDEVTHEVTERVEFMRHDWLVMLEPHIHRFEVGAITGGVSFNSAGSKAMAELMHDMANKLDYAKHQLTKEVS